MLDSQHSGLVEAQESRIKEVVHSSVQDVENGKGLLGYRKTFQRANNLTVWGANGIENDPVTATLRHADESLDSASVVSSNRSPEQLKKIRMPDDSFSSVT